MLDRIADIIRGLAADSVQQANSGHPGLPLGAAEVGAAIYSEILQHNPKAPAWPDRDRFVLSAGHGSVLLYSLLHLTGYDLPMTELQRFRQLGSRTPGHPEHGVTPGVETSTGPLGQGFANAVGMALAEAMLAARFNRPNYEIVDHYTYVLAGDGDMMEGISAEAASLAGHWGLNKLICIYDSNRISIEGRTGIAFTESVADRFLAHGWHVQTIDGHDVHEIISAIRTAQAEKKKPSLIVAQTTIGRKSTREDSPKAHGEPLGEEGVSELKKTLGLPDEAFHVPEDVYEYYAQKRKIWTAGYQEWKSLFAKWSQAFPQLREEWDAAFALSIPEDLAEGLPNFESGSELATRDASGQTLQKLAAALPYLVGGSADLSPSTKTFLADYPSVQKGAYHGRNLHFGVREHAMGAILNGMSLHGGWRVFGSTFLVFADYMRPAMRMAALMNQPVIYVLTHDSIYVGEDGPTHQPVEHAESLRLIPNLRVFRPADAAETQAAWISACQRTDGPTALLLTRQKLPTLAPADAVQEGVSRGGYVFRDCDGQPDLTLIATGSEVSLACATADLLTDEGYSVRVVSVPCRELFLAQDRAYQRSVLPHAGRRLAIEAGVTNGWHVLLRSGDAVLGIDRFGESGPAAQLAQHLGFTAENVVEHARELLD